MSNRSCSNARNLGLCILAYLFSNLNISRNGNNSVGDGNLDNQITSNSFESHEALSELPVSDHDGGLSSNVLPTGNSRLNMGSAGSILNEDYSQLETSERSDEGNKMKQEQQKGTTAKSDILETQKDKLWRRSHSSSTVETYEYAMKKFEEYMSNKSLIWEDVIKAPIQVLDDFSGWLDEQYAPSTTRLYVHFTKKTMKALGAKIDSDDFRENVSLPKQRVFMDDKVNEEQIRRIVIAIKNERWKILLMLMKDTAARPTELLGVRLGDIILTHDPPFLTIIGSHSKNDIPREVFFTPETKSMLLGYIKNRNLTKRGDFIFMK